MSSIIHRYSLPTCTLEILGKASPLFRSVNHGSVKPLLFRLNFDDPRLPKDDHLTIEGNLQQLNQLQVTVEHYIQKRLNPLKDDPSLGYAPPQKTEDPFLSLVGTWSSKLEELRIPSLSATPSRFNLRLYSSDFLTHQLCLGDLTPVPTQVQLSTLQLFDLASALTQHTEEALVLSPPPRSSGWNQNWGQIAALAVLTLGLATSTIKLFDGSPVANSASGNLPKSSLGASSLDQQTSLIQPFSSSQPATSPMVDPTLSATAPSPSPSSMDVQALDSNLNPYPSSQLPPDMITLPPPPPINLLPPPTLSIPEPLPVVPQTTPKLAAIPLAGVNNQFNPNSTVNRKGSRKPTTAFDTIPQVAEVRSYFEQRWSPPNTLTQTLEYRLLLSSDGSVSQIIPLGDAAGAFVDRTGIPLVGDPFVSPLEGSKRPMLRLVLANDGRVQVFLESFN